MSAIAATFRSRVEPSLATAILAVGDVAAIAAFVVLGVVGAHGGTLGNVTGMLETLTPFLVGWLLATVLGSLYTADARRSALRAISWTVPAWITAAVIAQLLRASPLFADSLSPVFLLVSIVTGLAILLPWRGLAAYWLSGGTLY